MAIFVSLTIESVALIDSLYGVDDSYASGLSASYIFILNKLSQKFWRTDFLVTSLLNIIFKIDECLMLYKLVLLLHGGSRENVIYATYTSVYLT
jgi:hypothetical protein